MTGKVLIVDDCDESRQRIGAILRVEDYHVLEAKDGEAAIRLCLEEQPHLVVLDIQLPGKSGLQVCAELKADARSREIPIIFLSSMSKPIDRIRGLALGGVDYITKPVDTGEILARVSNQVKIRHLTRSLQDANHLLRERQQCLEEDLRAAASIQSSLIPRTVPELEGLDVAWRFRPCESIGGDIFNLHRLDEEHLALYMIDVSGHGVPSAMITVSVSQSMSPQAGLIQGRNGIDDGANGPDPTLTPTSFTPPSRVLDLLDREYPWERFEKHFTICYLVFNLRTGRLWYSSAGRPTPLLVRHDGSRARLEAGGTVIGMGGLVPFEEEELQLLPGDRLFLYTDGIPEAVDEQGQEFGEQRFFDLLTSTREVDLDQACERVLLGMREFTGSVEPNDDITLLGIERGPVDGGLAGGGDGSSYGRG